MRILFDDAFFQYANSGIARYWRSVLEAIQRDQLLGDDELIIFNRSRELEDLGFAVFPAPSRPWDSRHAAQHRDLVSRVCQSLEIDVYVSSYYSFALDTPTLLPVYDLIPEAIGFDEADGAWLERKLAILAADCYLTISESTRIDLQHLYGAIPKQRIAVARPGVDHRIFSAKSPSEVEAFRSAYRLPRPYLVIPGSRFGAEQYKNGRLLFDAVQEGFVRDLDIVATSGETLTATELDICREAGIQIVRLVLEDDELGVCFGGAEVVVYPSMYEGFGLPALEALACGVPVIATHRSSLPESVGGLASFITGGDPWELGQAIESVRLPDYRAKIRTEGPRWAAYFDWSRTAAEFIDAARRCAASGLERSAEIRTLVAEYQGRAVIQQR